MHEPDGLKDFLSPLEKLLETAGVAGKLEPSRLAAFLVHMDDLYDDADPDLDLTTASIWYADLDQDGFGDANNATQACAQPTGYEADATDCDDADAGVNPAAVEICNGVDDDCDGSVDADALDADTWYLDADGDALGDPAVWTVECSQPTGYVGNPDDCDDTVYTGDMDGDGLDDCEDDDRDGDGLRNEWDAAPSDSSVVQGPTLGLGTDGDWTVSGEMSTGTWTLLSTHAQAGDDKLWIDDPSLFAEGDEVLVISLQGTDAGVWDTVFVTSASGSRINIEPPLDMDFTSSSVVQVQKIPHYVDVEITTEAVSKQMLD